MTNNDLNNLVVSYQHGNESALRDIFKAIHPLIEKASLEVEPFSHDYTKFDCRMVVKAKQLIETFNADTDNFIGIFKARLEKEKTQFIKRDSRKSLLNVSFSLLTGEDKDLGYQIEDPSPTPEENFLVKEQIKEKVALLSQGDPKKEVILYQWSKGTEDKTIARLLSQRFGGKAESHRKFITRFKKQCRNRLSSEPV